MANNDLYTLHSTSNPDHSQVLTFVFDTTIFLMVVSFSVFCCLRIGTLLHVLEGDHLLSHWLKVGRTLTQFTAAAKLNQ